MPRHLLLTEDTLHCSHCHSFILTIRLLLTDCLGLRHMYRHYFHSSSNNLTYIIGENSQIELSNFLKDTNFYHDILLFYFSFHSFFLIFKCLFINLTYLWMGNPIPIFFNLFDAICPLWSLCH